MCGAVEDYPVFCADGTGTGTGAGPDKGKSDASKLPNTKSDAQLDKMG